MPKTKNLFSQSSSGQKSKIKVLGGLISEGARSFFTSSWLPVAANSPWFAVAHQVSASVINTWPPPQLSVSLCVFSRGLHVRMQLLDLVTCYHVILTSYKCKKPISK